MNDFDQAFVEFKAAQQTRRSAEDWLAALETALASQDVALIGALFHEDCHWRDILACTWGPAHDLRRRELAHGRWDDTA